MTIGVLKETQVGETRVAMVPEVVSRVMRKDFKVVIESGAGENAHYLDADFTAAGATIGSRADALSADILVTVQPPADSEIANLTENQILMGFFRPLDDLDRLKKIIDSGVTAISAEMVPRTSRAQKMDALSAMSSISGYKAALLGADNLPKFFPLLTTAAGTVRPAKVMVLGAGVAGLQAIATAKRLGAIVSAYDVRPAAAEEVQSLGAKFIELDLDTSDAAAKSGYAKALDKDKAQRQVELLVPHIAESDVVIATALIPGRKAPILILDEAVNQMQSGSVIIDMAASNGGNCALSKPDEVVTVNGVKIFGDTNLPAGMPHHSSQLYSRTLMAMILEFAEDGAMKINLEDEILQSAVVSHKGEIINARIKSILQPAES